MLGQIQGFFYPPAYGHQHHGRSIIVDTIVAVALSALSFIIADSVDRSNPELASVFRIIPAGISLIWLFRRFNCGGGRWGGGGGYQAPVVHVAPQPYYNRWTNWLPNWPWRGGHHHHHHHVHNPAPMYVAPVHRGPVVYQAPPVDPRSHAYGAGAVHHTNQPHVGGPFPAVQRAPAQPFVQHAHAAQVYHQPKQAHTTYSAVNHGGGDLRSHAPMNAAVHHTNQPRVGGAFPAVQRASAQEYSAQNSAANQRSMFVAPTHR